MMKKKREGTIELDIEELRKDLIEFYTEYMKNPKESRLIEEVKDYDGAWTCHFLLPDEVSRAATSLVYFYVDPKLKQEDAKEIRDALVKGKRR